MSSAGQIVGGIVGAVAGSFVNAPMLGAQLGMMLGGALDPPKGNNTSGPRLNDLTIQTSTYGAIIPRIYVTCAINGNIFWLKGNKIDEIPVKKKAGGKGGSKSTNTTWVAYATFAVGICKGPITGVRRIWIKGELFYDAGSSDPATIAASNDAAEGFTLYTGTDTQMPDPMIVADKGAEDTPAYRGLAYLVFNNLALAKYGNALIGAQVRVEVLKDGEVDSYPVTYHDGVISNKQWDRPAWNGSVFCSITSRYTGTEHYSITSSDGITWTETTLPLSGDSQEGWKDVAGSPGGSFIAIRSFNPTSKVARSTNNGNTWNWVDLPISCLPHRITYGGGIFLIIDRYGGKALYSNNEGISWQYANLPNTGDFESQVQWSDSLGKFFVEVYRGGGVTNHILSSSTGEFWDTVSVYPSANWKYMACMGNTVILASNYDADGLLVTTNGTSWTRITSPIYPCSSVTGVESDGLVFLFVSSTTYWYTYDLSTYYTKSIPVHGLATLSTPRWNGAIFSIVTHSTALGQTLTIPRRSITSSSVSLSSIVSQECLQGGVLTSGDIDCSALTPTVRGYVVSTSGTIKSALEPLQSSWPFDVVQRGYKVYFILRGGSSVATINASDLDARSEGNNAGVLITTTIDGDTHLPRKLTVKHIDVDRDYEIGEQYAERYNTSAISEDTVDLAVVLNATEAAGKAEVLLYLYWMERFDVSVTVPAIYNNLEPGDVITLVTPDGPVIVRLIGVNYTSDGRVEIRSKYANSAVYTPTAVGSYSAVSGPSTIASAGKSSYVLLDVPYMHPAQADPSFLAAMYGSNSWPGGVLMRTDDSGTTWTELQGFASPGSTVGYTTNSIGIVDSRVWDKGSALSVVMSNGDLYSVSELAVLNGTNRFAYGIPGRWEIIGVQNCSLVSAGTYKLYDILRGQYGTEWAMGTHAIGDYIILLSDSDVSAIGMSVSSIGLSREYRGITLDQTIDTDIDYPFTYVGVNLECLSPVYFTGYRLASTDWVLSWLRRSRTDGEWRDYVDVGLGETSEAYQVDIFTDNTFTTVKRTIASSTTTCTYTSAQQVVDFGAAQSYVYAMVYQMSSTVGRGYPAKSTMVL